MESNAESAMYELRLALYDMIRVTKGVIENRDTILNARKRIEAAEGILNKHFKIADVLRGESAGESDAVEFAEWVRDNTVPDGAPKLFYKHDISRYSIAQLYTIFKQQNTKL